LTGQSGFFVDLSGQKYDAKPVQVCLHAPRTIYEQAELNSTGANVTRHFACKRRVTAILTTFSHLCVATSKQSSLVQANEQPASK